MRKRFALAAMLLLCGCSSTTHATTSETIDSFSTSDTASTASSSSSSLVRNALEGEVRLFGVGSLPKAWRTLMIYDRFHIEEDLCGFEFPTHIFKTTDFSSLLPGDRFEAEWEAEEKGYRTVETCPAILEIYPKAVLFEKVTKASVVKVAVVEGEIQPIDGVRFDTLFQSKAINESGEYVPLESITEGYATISTKREGCARAIYTYNPRAE